MKFTMKYLVTMVLASWYVAGQSQSPGPVSTFAAVNEQLLGLSVVEEVDTVDIEGTEEGRVVIERVVAYPEPSKTDEITLRNIGGQTVDMTGWVIMDNREAPDQYVFGGPGCEDQAILEPGFATILYPQSEERPCGFDFKVSFADNLTLFNATGDVVSAISWSQSSKGTALYRTEEDRYIVIPEGTETVVGVLSLIPDFSYFLEALKQNDLYDLLKAPSDPDNLIPFIPQSPEPNYFELIEFPWWFGYARDRSEYPQPDPLPTPPVVEPGVPELGPYTLLVPTNKAFREMRDIMFGTDQAPMSYLFRLPEMRTILEYHILGGGYSSAYMFNDTPIITTQGQDVLIVRDPKQIEGAIAIMDACVDKPTPGYDCEQQVEFGKCLDPFMLSPLSAQWQGGFCQRSCQRCSCDSQPCAMVKFADIMATNGVIHAIDRLLFPAPFFEMEVNVTAPVEEEDDPDAEEFIRLLQASIGDLPSLPPGVGN